MIFVGKERFKLLRLEEAYALSPGKLSCPNCGQLQSYSEKAEDDDAKQTGSIRRSACPACAILYTKGLEWDQVHIKQL